MHRSAVGTSVTSTSRQYFSVVPPATTFVNGNSRKSKPNANRPNTKRLERMKEIMQTTLDDIKLSTEDTTLGRPLVFIHGFPFSRSVWQRQIDAFRSSYRVIAPDLCGFGVSPTR